MKAKGKIWKHECEDCGQIWFNIREEGVCPECQSENVFHFEEK